MKKQVMQDKPKVSGAGRFGPNYSLELTTEQAEKEFSYFKFMGPGWYVTDHDAMLVIPVNRPVENLWRGPNFRARVREKFWFHVFGKDQVGVFSLIANAPTRLDSRT